MKKTKQIAFGGIICGLSLVIMLLTGIFPFAEYSCPALAGIVLISLVIEYGKKTAFIAYCAIAILSAIIVPNKEAAILFVFFLGYYPIIKSVFEKCKSRILEWILKLLTFNTSVILSYIIMLNVLSMTNLTDDFKGIAIPILLILGNIVFIVYDFALNGLANMYYYKIKPKLKGVTK
ncbi:MAG: hypothetical protein RSE93_08020 [Oscillospiraceae bacterium]